MAAPSNLVLLIVGLLTYAAIFLGIHALLSFGPYRMARHAGIPYAWLGLLPIGAGWLLGLLAERALYARTGRRCRLALWVPACQGVALCGFAMVAGLALRDEEFGGWVVLAIVLFLVGGVAGTVFFYYSLYCVFQDYAPESAVLYTILGILLNVYFIFLLVERNTVPVSVTGPGAFPYGRPKYDRWHQWGAAPPQYGYPQGYGGCPPPGGGPSYTTQGYYSPQNPGQQPPQTPYSGNPGQTPYAGQGPQFYQGGSGYYQPQQPYDPSRNFPSGGYDPKHPEGFFPPERPQDDKPNNGPEL